MFFQLLFLSSSAGLLIIFFQRLRITLKDLVLQKQIQKEQMYEAKSLLSSEEYFAQELKRSVAPTRKKLAEHAKTVRELLRFAETHLAKGLLSDAERDFIRVLAFEPRHLQAHHKLGMIYLEQKNMIKAEQMFRSTIKIKKDPVYQDNLALTLYYQERFPEAAKEYEKAVKLDNKGSARYINLALVYHQMGEVNKALKNFEKASSLEPRNTRYLSMRAHLYEDLNRKQEALCMYKEILEYEPYNEEAKRALVRLQSEVSDETN